MARYARPGETLPITIETPTSGQVGTLGATIKQGATVIAPRTTAGFVEVAPGIYTWTGTMPEALGTFTVVFDDGGATPDDNTAETIIVNHSGRIDLAPAPEGLGPCSLWTTAEAIAACCTDLPEDADLDTAAQVASALLWEWSGRAFSGRCRAVVRPMDRRPACSPRAYGRSWFPRGCRALSRVRLAGYPVHEIVEVRVDGAAVDPAGYMLVNGRDLLRTAEGEWWPSCQYLDRPTSEEGTFQVVYDYGALPPTSARQAAAALGCMVAKACGGGECDLPPNTRQILRQGLTVTLDAADGLKGPLSLPEVQAFLALRRPAGPGTVYSPDLPPYPIVISTGPAPEPEEES